MKDDKIVSEVRRAREQIFAEAGGTLDGLYARLKKLEKKHKNRLVSPAKPRKSQNAPLRRESGRGKNASARG